jgi:hypothetical protein
MVDFIKIQGNRAFASTVPDTSFVDSFHVDADPAKNLVKGVTFKIYQGPLGRFLAILGFAVKVKTGLTGPTDPKIVYVNKNSLIKHNARLNIYAQEAETKDWVKKISDAYESPSKMSQDDKKAFNECKKVARSQLKAFKASDATTLPLYIAGLYEKVHQEYYKSE